MYTSIYYSADGIARNCGTLAYLVNYAGQMLTTYGGSIEIRDAHGTLIYSFWTMDNGDIKVWSAS